MTESVLPPEERRPSLGRLFLGRAAPFIILAASLWLLFAYDRAVHVHRFLDVGPEVFLGQWWRPVTYIWMHVNSEHLMANLLSLAVFGVLTTWYFNARAWFTTFMLSGIISGLVVVLIQPWVHLAGASGAIMGLYGMVLAASIRCYFRGEESPSGLVLNPILLSFVFILQVHADYGAAHVSGLAHVAGVATGFALGWILRFRHTDE